MDVNGLYTNIRKKALLIVRKAYEEFHDKHPPIATHFRKEMLSLILKENSFQFNGKKNISLNTRNGSRHENGYSFCQYFYGKNRTNYLEAKHKETTSMEKVY